MLNCRIIHEEPINNENASCSKVLDIVDQSEWKTSKILVYIETTTINQSESIPIRVDASFRVLVNDKHNELKIYHTTSNTSNTSTKSQNKKLTK